MPLDRRSPRPHILFPDFLQTQMIPYHELSDGLEHYDYTGMSDPLGSIQTPSPTHSHSSTPLGHSEEPVVVSVSTAFHPEAHPHPPDLIFSSSDSVLFYVHSHVLLAASGTAFESILGATLSSPKHRAEIVHIPEPSDILNIILHILYRTSSAPHAPPFAALVTAIDRLPHYGFAPAPLITPHDPIHAQLLAHAPLHPLDLYALAAHWDLPTLAAPASAHLLAFPLATLSDAAAARIGAVYLKRLLCLRMDRAAAFREILVRPPHPHPPARACGFGEQKALTRAWALAAAHLVWEARPDMSIYSLRGAFEPLMEQMSCEQCRQVLSNRVKEVVVQWTSVKLTI